MSETRLYKAIGLMSGTSLDGMDVALLETDGQNIVKPLGSSYLPYDPELKDRIRACFGLTDHNESSKQAERDLTLLHAEAIRHFLDKEELKPGEIDVIGFHGQTVTHKPKEGFTWQMGDGQLLAREIGIDVVNDFRSADVKGGGQGAPLIPVYHEALARSKNLSFPCVLLNIGGVANVTWIGKEAGNLFAFDTGPGNALMDDMMKHAFQEEYDFNGEKAAEGQPRLDLVEAWMKNDYFCHQPPKSLDRGFLPKRGEEHVNADLNVFDVGAIWDLKPENAMATLAHFTATAIAEATKHFPEKALQWFIGGGGRHNTYLMKLLAEKLGVPIEPLDNLGFSGDATEAECFAYLAVRHLKKLPLSFPGTTGVKVPQLGGKFYSK